MAVRIDKVYTRGGDEGKTSLIGGSRVDKDCLRLECCGAVDELNCWVGVARTAAAAESGSLPRDVRMGLEASLRRIQNRLFDLGSVLAAPAGQTRAGMPEILDGDSETLEREMDAMQEALEPLDSFCLPGGTPLNGWLHHCRTACRRAERKIVSLSREEPVDKRVLKFVNRLSDFFFTAARYAARQAGAKEYLWEYGTGGTGASGINRSGPP